MGRCIPCLDGSIGLEILPAYGNFHTHGLYSRMMAYNLFVREVGLYLVKVNFLCVIRVICRGFGCEPPMNPAFHTIIDQIQHWLAEVDRRVFSACKNRWRRSIPVQDIRGWEAQ
jgi:hypothetical protein